jgi:hypothetical protein
MISYQTLMFWLWCAFLAASLTCFEFAVNYENILNRADLTQEQILFTGAEKGSINTFKVNALNLGWGYIPIVLGLVCGGLWFKQTKTLLKSLGYDYSLMEVKF